MPKDITFSSATWWENEESTRAIKYATVGAIWLGLLGIIIMVTEGGWATLTIGRAYFIVIVFAFIGAIAGMMGIETEELYLFSWNEVPGNYNDRFIEFIEQRFHTYWVKAANIEKIDNGKTIRVSSEKNYLLLSLNDEETEVDLKIDDGRTAKFNVKAEKGKLNIYEEGINFNFN